MEKQSDWLGDVFKIAIGIALGAFIIWRVSVLYLGYQVGVASREIHAQADSVAAKLKEQQRQKALSELNAKLVDRQRRVDQYNVEIAAQDAERRKEIAWQAYFHPAPECLDSTRSDVSIQCGNAYIVARRQFEASWKP